MVADSQDIVLLCIATYNFLSAWFESWAHIRGVIGKSAAYGRSTWALSLVVEWLHRMFEIINLVVFLLVLEIIKHWALVVSDNMNDINHRAVICYFGLKGLTPKEIHGGHTRGVCPFV